MNKKIENKFFETTDYTRFKKTRGNRPVDEAHVAQLKKLIKIWKSLMANIL